MSEGGEGQPPETEGRRWRWDDGEWSASVDRLRGRCGECRPERWLHIDTPRGRRYTFRLSADARLAELAPAALVGLVRRASADDDASAGDRG